MLAKTPSNTRWFGTILAACALALGLLAGPLTLPAHAEGTAATFVVDANLDADGTLKVSQVITFSGAVPPQLSQKFETREDLVGDRQYVQTHQRRDRLRRGRVGDPGRSPPTTGSPR